MESMVLGIERLNYILSRIERNSSVKVEELSRELSVSSITIRRDLKTLEEQSKLTRTYGGAVSKAKRILSREEQYSDKRIHTHGAKTAMARRCLEMIPDGASIFLDSGTSVFEVARLLNTKNNLKVITCDLLIASELYQAGIHTFVTGGEIQNETGSLFGPSTEDFISSIRVDIGIIGVAGISDEGTLYTPTMEKSKLKVQAMRSSIITILLADSVKFDVSSLWSICSLKDFDHIITDVEFSAEEWKKRGVKQKNICHVLPDRIKER